MRDKFKVSALWTVLGILFFLFPFSTLADPSLRRCRNSFGLINHEGTIPLENYSRPVARSSEKYVQFLGELYSQEIKSLRPGQIVLDVGGGLGLASLQDSRNKKVRAIVINAQDAMGDGLRSLLKTSIGNHLLFNLAEHLKVSLKGLPLSRKVGYGPGGPFSFYETNQLKVKHWETIRKRVFSVYQEQGQKGLFQYRADYAENVLPGMQEKVTLIRDLYGAYYYSADRIQLLEEYYRLLDDNGIAFVRLSSNGQVGPSNEMADGKRLEDELIKQFRKVFSYADSTKRVLVVRKDKTLSSLSLSKRYEITSVNMRTIESDEGSDMTIPDIKIKRSSPSRRLRVTR